MKNTIRIEVEEEHRGRKDFKFVVREILLGVFALKNDDILCLQDQERLLANKEMREDRLEGLHFFLLYGLEDVHLVVHMYNPHIDTADVSTFLQRYCSEVRFSHMVKGGQGHWNGKRKYFVKLRRDPDGIGGFMHPPSNFSIGRNRGYLFYSGMPLYCRNCSRFGHTKEACPEAKLVRCHKCDQPGHIAASCKLQMTCNMCGQAGHTYKDCPSKASKKKGAGPSEKTKPGPGSEQRPAAVAGPAKMTLEASGEQSMTPEKAVVERRGSYGPEKTPAGQESSVKDQSLRRRSVASLGQGSALPTVALVPIDTASTQAVRSEHSAVKVPGAVESEQAFAIPTATVPARKGESTSRRASTLTLKELEQEVKTLSVLSFAKTIPDAPEEKWITVEDKKKVRRSQRRRRAEAAGSSATEESGVEDRSCRKPKEKATGAPRGKEGGSPRPAEKRMKSEVAIGVRRRSSCSSEGDFRRVVDPQHVSSSDPVNIEDPASPEQGEEGSRVISCESSPDSDMDSVTSKDFK
ncbi:hypothetical protein XELAEV_18040126mg [Xenopus laevis]|uniref:CCHC-type domain-containing protein n=1 Tax=Xenopus laevis TaxID=8355 RepID=A0A974C956_XENLA|nr:hypothetical protein XELAEV_18040126mg [Xenopus laevis]